MELFMRTRGEERRMWRGGGEGVASIMGVERKMWTKNTYDDLDSFSTRLGSCLRISDSLTASVSVLKTVLCVL